MPKEITSRDRIFVKELIGYFKAANAYELFDEHGMKIGEVKEQVPGVLRKILKFTDLKPYLPFLVEFFDENQQRYLSIERKFSIFRSNVLVFDQDQRLIGRFRQKVFSLGGRFFIFGRDSESLGEVRGKWTGWDFTVVDASDREIAQITKKWAGIGKELFTSADNYIISIRPEIGISSDFRKLIFAAGICIDMVLKEKTR